MLSLYSRRGLHLGGRRGRQRGLDGLLRGGDVRAGLRLGDHHERLRRREQRVVAGGAHRRCRSASSGRGRRPVTLSVACLAVHRRHRERLPCLDARARPPSAPRRSRPSSAELGEHRVAAPLIQSKLQTRSMAPGRCPRPPAATRWPSAPAGRPARPPSRRPGTACTLVAVSVGMVMKFLLAMT